MKGFPRRFPWLLGLPLDTVDKGRGMSLTKVTMGATKEGKAMTQNQGLKLITVKVKAS